jgi:hypothetical protein
MSRLVRAARHGLGAARRRVPALLACLLAVAVVFGGLRSGAHLFFCAGMGSLADKPCCAPARDGDSSRDSALREGGDDDCCAGLDLGTVPEGTATAPEPIRSAPLAMVRAPVPLQVTPPASAVSPRAGRDATESPPPTAPERCALHRVFLI